MGLFSSIKIKDMNLKNRIVLAPMCMKQSTNGFANIFHVIHYASRAIGQTALLILEATAVSPEGRITNKDLGIWSDEHIKGLKKIVDEVHNAGGKIGIQLAHAGRKARDEKEPLAPSNLSYSDYPIPKTMTIDEIEKIKTDFKNATLRALEAGFDFIEIHAAHGYLINQFLSPLSNKRTDKYGGTKGNRNRILFEIINEVRSKWPENKPLGLRLSLTDYDKDGLVSKDYIELLNNFKNNDIDIVNVTTGGLLIKDVDEYTGYQLKFAKELKDNTNFIIMTGGLINSSQLSNSIIKNNEADLIYYGRLSLREPYFPLRFAKELKEEIIWPEPYINGKY